MLFDDAIFVVLNVVLYHCKNRLIYMSLSYYLIVMFVRLKALTNTRSQYLRISGYQ